MTIAASPGGRTQKTCSRCGEDKPLGDFYLCTAPNGRKYPAGRCKRCAILVEKQRKYGLSPEQFAELVEAQDGRCKICGLLPDGSKQSQLHVDHDHRTGLIRGLLCGQCNVALGVLHSPYLLERAGEYLRTAGVVPAFQTDKLTLGEYDRIMGVARERFLAGREKYRGTWARVDLKEDVRQELMDLAVYAALMIARLDRVVPDFEGDDSNVTYEREIARTR